MKPGSVDPSRIPRGLVESIIIVFDRVHCLMPDDSADKIRSPVYVRRLSDIKLAARFASLATSRCGR